MTNVNKVDSNRKFLSGNQAVAEGVRLSDVAYVSAYPITPQTTIVETLADMVAGGRLDADFMEMESEHSALSSCLGAAACGLRTFTATSSQGLAYMHEVLHYTSGSRLPVVMAVVTRALATPWNIYGDQRDSVSQRDTGWIQLYVESAQEALDTTIQAYRIAEDEKVLTPVMVCLDGYTISHTYEPVLVPDIGEVRNYLPSFQFSGSLTAGEPRSMCFSAGPEWNIKFKKQQHLGITNALEVIERADAEFGRAFGRHYGGLVERCQTDDAEAVLVAMGAVCGTIKECVDRLRSRGVKVGLLRLRSLRPFPRKEIVALAETGVSLGVIDKNISFGYEGAVFSEIKAAIYNIVRAGQNILGFVAGLGGRDINLDDVEHMYELVLGKKETSTESIFWE